MPLHLKCAHTACHKESNSGVGQSSTTMPKAFEDTTNSPERRSNLSVACLNELPCIIRHRNHWPAAWPTGDVSSASTGTARAVYCTSYVICASNIICTQCRQYHLVPFDDPLVELAAKAAVLATLPRVWRQLTPGLIRSLLMRSLYCMPQTQFNGNTALLFPSETVGNPDVLLCITSRGHVMVGFK